MSDLNSAIASLNMRLANWLDNQPFDIHNPERAAAGTGDVMLHCYRFDVVIDEDEDEVPGIALLSYAVIIDTVAREVGDFEFVDQLQWFDTADEAYTFVGKLQTGKATLW